MRELPGGTVTLLFTDIEGSTRLLQELGREEYVRALTAHRRMLRDACRTHGGIEVEMQGDSFHFAFPVAGDAVAAAAAAQRQLAEYEWESEPIRVRMGLHTGEPMQADGLYAGLDVHWAARIMSAAHGGQVLLSQRTAELVGETLAETVRLVDLGEHRLKDLSAPQRLYQAVVGAQPAEFPPLRTLHVTNLPIQANRLIGRREELREVARRLLDRDTRVLTLTGPGGTGKTRLALQAAADVADRFEGGTYFVPLAAIHDPALVLPSVAKSLGVREESGRALSDVLSEHLGQQERLLVLDNFEHVVESASEVAAMVASTPSLSLLVTSREPLRISGEQRYLIPPLPLLPGGPEPRAAAALENDAVALFVERARAARPGFELTDANAPAVAAICARLDGLPLAIELAAARVGILSPDAMAKRMDRSLDLLESGRRDAEARQRTLRSTIEWSYDLLDERERQLLAHLSVFVGGCGLEAAEAVCAAGGGSVFPRLASLVEKSLVQQSAREGGEPRFWMLETIRDYAAERLSLDVHRDEVRRRHAEWLIRLTEDADLAGEEAEEWLALIEPEHDNVRAALAWSIEAGLSDIALRLAVGISPFWDIHGHYREARGWVDRTLSLPPSADRSLTAKALGQAGGLAYVQGDLDRADEAGAAALDIFVELGDSENVSLSLTMLARTALKRGDLLRAQSLYERAADVAREAGLARQVAATVLNLGDLAFYRADYERAESLAREARQLLRDLDSSEGAAFAGLNVALALILRGDPRAATAELVEPVTLSWSLGAKGGLAAAFDTLCAALEGDGRPQEAARMLGAAEAIREDIGSEREAFESSMIEEIRERLVARLGAAELGSTIARGRAMALEDAVAYALEQAATQAPVA